MPVEKIKKAKKTACTEGVIAPTKSCQASKMLPKKMLIQVGVYNMCTAKFFTEKIVWQLVLKKGEKEVLKTVLVLPKDWFLRPKIEKWLALAFFEING